MDNKRTGWNCNSNRNLARETSNKIAIIWADTPCPCPPFLLPLSIHTHTRTHRHVHLCVLVSATAAAAIFWSPRAFVRMACTQIPAASLYLSAQRKLTVYQPRTNGATTRSSTVRYEYILMCFVDNLITNSFVYAPHEFHLTMTRTTEQISLSVSLSFLCLSLYCVLYILLIRILWTSQNTLEWFLQTQNEYLECLRRFTIEHRKQFFFVAETIEIFTREIKSNRT